MNEEKRIIIEKINTLSVELLKFYEQNIKLEINVSEKLKSTKTNITEYL
jgi:hypothetical protein